MTDYTPTTEEVRSDAIQLMNEAAFDRWLAAHDAEKRAEWEAEQGEPSEPMIPERALTVLRKAFSVRRLDFADLLLLGEQGLDLTPIREQARRELLPEPQGEPAAVTTDAAARAAVGSPPSEQVSEAPDSECEALRVGAHEERHDAVQVEVDKGGDDSIHTRSMRAVPNRTETQREPTDAQVIAAMNALRGYEPPVTDISYWSERYADTMRAALRAAAAVTEQGGESR